MAAFTETADPLPSPPSWLTNDPGIKKSLETLRDYIKVDTPFNVDCLKHLLVDHSNQLFVQSVMTGL